MTATVIDLSSRRRNPAPTCGCPRHQLGALVDRTRALLEQTDGELLIPRDDLSRAFADLTATSKRLLAPIEETNP